VAEKQYKVVHTDPSPLPITKEQFTELKKIGAEVIFANCQTENDVIECCRDADGIMNCYAPLTRRVIESLRNCKIIARLGIGYDNVDVEAATDYGIAVTNVPDYCFEEVSNHSIALLLACARKLVYLSRGISEGRWEERPSPMVSIYGQTLGLVGCGSIGQATARKASCFGLRLLGCDPFLDGSVAKEYGITLVSLPVLLRESDFISMHVPLNKKTRHFICEKEFRQMKPTAYFINTARGPIVDEAALIKALREGWIAGAGLDVFGKEPVSRGNPLPKMDNVVLTPHIAFYSDASGELLRSRGEQSVVDVLSGEMPRNLVNPAVRNKLFLRDRS
jgi:D-3-phosphoglycerate dehydrogenase